MIPITQGSEAITSGNMESATATIVMTPEMASILSSQIYTDTRLATIRETICNARDSQVESGVDRPLDLHLPNRLEPFFSIRDFGEGISHEKMMKTYMGFGVSTKQTSNDTIGGMGIGCKSPLSYTDSFVVVSTHKGIETTYSVYKELGMPKITPMSKILSTNPEGLLVKVPVLEQDFSAFQLKAEQFLTFFDYPTKVSGGTVNIEKKLFVESDEYSLYEPIGGRFSSSRINGVYVSMGGVIYQVSNELADKVNDITAGKLMVIPMPIGSLTVAASRERLSEDRNTTEVLEKKIEEISVNYYKDIATDIENEKTLAKKVEKIKENSLVHSNYRTGKWTNTTAGTFVRIGNTLTSPADIMETYVEKLGDLKAKKKSPRCAVATFSISQVPTDSITFLFLDKKTGFNKVLAKTGTWMVFLNNEEDIKVVKDVFGEDIKIENLSELYENYFPKGEKTSTISTKRSGIFTARGEEVTSLEESDTGLYFKFNRFDCETDGFDSWDSVVSLLKRFPDSLVKDIYLVRAGGLKHVKRTGIKPITEQHIKDKIKSACTKTDLDKMVQQGVVSFVTEPFAGGRLGIKLWEALAPFYKDLVLEKVYNYTSEGYTLLTGLRAWGYTKYLPESVEKEIKDKILTYTDKRKELEDKFFPFTCIKGSFLTGQEQDKLVESILDYQHYLTTKEGK